MSDELKNTDQNPEEEKQEVVKNEEKTEAGVQEQAEAKEAVEQEKKHESEAVSQETHPDPDEDFDWDSYEEGMDNLDSEALKEFEDLIEKQVTVYEENDVIEGVVTKITEKDVIIDINSKSEGVVSRDEFRYNPDLKPGDKV
jgi:small subunit ribosomal protein S1